MAEFEKFLDQHVSPNLSAWVEQKAIPRGLFRALGQTLICLGNTESAAGSDVAALSLGTAVGAFELGLEHAVTRKAFGRRVVDFEAKAFEAADGYARLEAARLALWKACWLLDEGGDFRAAAAVAKYLAVAVAQDVTRWAADLFGAASVVYSHPIHKYPMDAWASSLGEGTQDIQKLVIFRELMKERGYSSG